MLWLALHLPLLSLEAFSATLDADRREAPLALLAAHRIAAVNPAAAACGVRAGLKRATALALAPALQIGQADPARDGQALQAVAHAALAFTPMVVPDGTHTVLLELQSCLRYFGGAARLRQRLLDALAPLGHRLQLAAAPTPGGAALLARWGAGVPVPDPAEGPHTTDPAALHTLLDRAPLGLLASAQAHRETLRGMGLHHLADLRALPRAGLARRFGASLLDEMDRARGDRPDPREPLALPPQFDSRLELFARADTTEQVLHGAEVLLARLVAWAQARHARVAAFTLRMGHEYSRREDQPTHSDLRIALAEPAADAAHLQLLLRERLARRALAAPTLDLRLRCRHLVQAPPPNQELFPTRGHAQEGLTRLLERLRARLGEAQVQALQPVADHRPEQASRGTPAVPPPAVAGRARRRPGTAAAPGRAGAAQPAGFSAPATVTVDAAPTMGSAGAVADTGSADRMADPRAGRRSPAGAPSGPPCPPLPLPRPAWLLPRPQPLHERQGQPLLDGRPLQIVGGPERIEAGWWDGPPAARDYFVAQAEGGALVWIYRTRLPPRAGDDPDAPEHGWWLQGRFG